MSIPIRPAEEPANGAGAAAVLASGIGSFLVAVLAIAGDKSAALKSFFTFSKATGPLSGVTTSAIVLWLLVWAVLHLRWRNRTLALVAVNGAALALLALAFLLTFPPLADLF
jgi:hypothetical protein